MVQGTPESHLRSETNPRYLSECLKRWLIIPMRDRNHSGFQRWQHHGNRAAQSAALILVGTLLECGAAGFCGPAPFQGVRPGQRRTPLLWELLGHVFVDIGPNPTQQLG
jgi:hypothetical protein